MSNQKRKNEYNKARRVIPEMCDIALKRKCNFDELLVTGCTESFDNFQCNQWLKFRQNNNSFVSGCVRYSDAILMEFHRAHLTHWGRVTHIHVGNLTTIGPDNGLSPGRRQAIIWTNARILLIVPWGTNFSEILLGIQTFSFKKMHLKMSSAKWRPFCLGLNVFISLPLKLSVKTHTNW